MDDVEFENWKAQDAAVESQNERQVAMQRVFRHFASLAVSGRLDQVSFYVEFRGKS